MRVLVTGAAGWSGSAVVGALLHAGHEVVRACPPSQPDMFARQPSRSQPDAGACCAEQVGHDLPASWQAEKQRAAAKTSPAWEVAGPAGARYERLEGDLLEAASVRRAVFGCDAVVHTAVLHPPSAEAVGGEDEVNRLTFLVQMNGLFNVLDAIADTPSVQRLVHVSSCWTAHPQVEFFDGSTRVSALATPALVCGSAIERATACMLTLRCACADAQRPDWSLYAVSKRTQEEMCEQYHTAHGLQIVMLRPDHIVDSRSGWNRAGQLTSAAVLEAQGDTGWVCRHDLASACVLAAETVGLGLEYLSVVGQTPAGKPLPEQTCNVIRTKQLLGWEARGDLEQWRAGSSAPPIELSPAQQRTFVDEGVVVPAPPNESL